MKFFTLKDPRILGEEHPTYGYSVWSETDGDYPVMFNTKNPNIMPGTRVTYDTAELKVSKNDKEYLRLKKVQLEDSPSEPKPFEKKAEPTFKKSEQAPTTDKAYLRDASTIPLDCWRTLIGIQGVPDSPTGFSVFFETVRQHAEELLYMIDNIRSGTSGSGEQSPPPSREEPEIKEEVAPAAGYEKFQKAKEAMTATDEYGEYEG